MNRNTAIVLAILIAVGIVGAVVYITYPRGDQMSMAVQFYDEDGGLIDVPAAITAGGVEVKELKVTASWTISGTDIEPGTFNVAVTYYIDFNDLDGVWRALIEGHTINSGDMVGSHAETWTLTTLLYEYMTEADKVAGWDLRIYARLVATAIDISGNAVDPVTMDTPVITASLEWYVAAGTLSIISCDVTRVIVIA